MDIIKDKDLVSVVITTHNRCNLVKRAINSVQNQTYANVEIIVVDDNSSDETEDVVNTILQSDNRVSYIKIPSNESKGGNYARNKGIENANGKYIAFLDDDDVWYPTKIEKQVDVLKGNSNLGAVSCEMRFVYDFGPKQYFDFSNTKIDRRPLGFFVNSWLNTTSTIMVKKDVLKEVGMFDLCIPALQECELSYRICLKYQVEILDEILVDYYIFPNMLAQITSSISKNKKALDIISSKYNSELEKLLPEQLEARTNSIKRGEALRYLRNDNRKEYRSVIKSIWKNTSKWEKIEYYLTYFIDYPNLIKLKCTLKTKRG